MQKTVVALRGVEGSGKTSTLKMFRELLLKKDKAQEHEHREIRNQERDFVSSLKLDGVSIYITSQGDGRYFMEGPLHDAVAKRSDIIFCACRSYGDTQKTIKECCAGYKIIWITKNKLDSDLHQKELRIIANKSSANLLGKVMSKIIAVT